MGINGRTCFGISVFMFYIGYTWTLLEELIEDILGIVEFCAVGRTLLERLHEETLGILEFHEVGRTLLEGSHEEALCNFVK